jgi:MFS family permease
MAPVSSILPSIADSLGVSVTAVGWVMNGYFLVLVGVVLLMGRLGDVFGHARVFSAGVGLCTAAGLVCGVSGSYAALVAARGAQGVGSAMIFGTSLAIIAAAIPARRQGQAIGLLTMASSASALIGVWAATWSVQQLSWHWAFILPAPIGMLGTALGLRLQLPARRSTSRHIDWPGAVLLFATLVSAMLGLNHLHEGEETFEAGAHYHVGMHILALVFLVAFLKVEEHSAFPLLNLALVRSARFAAAIAGNGLAHMSMLATGFLMPFLLERGRGLTPGDTGLLLMSQQLAMVACALGLGYLYDRTRSAFLGTSVMAVIAVGLVTLGVFGGALSYATLLLISVLMGAALGGFTTVNNTEIMSLAPPEQHGFAAGLIETTRQLGHSTGVSLSSSFVAGALAQTTGPSAASYVLGFEQATLAMGLVAAAGVGALLWTSVRSHTARPARRKTATGGDVPVAPIVGL